MRLISPGSLLLAHIMLPTSAQPTPGPTFDHTTLNLSDFLTISALPPAVRSDAVLDSIPYKASVLDQRAVYCMYVPTRAFNAANATSAKLPLIINIHGTSRRAEQCRDSLVPFADSQGAAVLAPLFPYGIGDPNDADNYKELLYEGIRYDEVLLGMLEEVKVRYEGWIDVEKIYLVGFSGGGQFVLRFAYLWPERVAAVSAGALGLVTSLNESLAWPRGLSDVQELFGRQLDVEKLKEIDWHLVVGELDTGKLGEGISDILGSQAGELGRVGTLENLKKEWEGVGIDARLDIVPGVEHEAIDVLPAVTSFLKKAVPSLDMSGQCI